MTEISFKLEKSSIESAIKQLRNYQDGLKVKCRIFCEKLNEAGLKEAEVHISNSPVGNMITVRSEITEEEAGCKGILIATGAVIQTQDYHPFNILLAVEFGAGIRYNEGNVNPHQDDFGMGVGTFPDQKFAYNKVWFYKGDDGKWHPSSGIRAEMPMYHAAEEMKDKIVECAKVAFGNK